MLTLEELIEFDGKNVNVKCKDGDIVKGICHVHSSVEDEEDNEAENPRNYIDVLPWKIYDDFIETIELAE